MFELDVDVPAELVPLSWLIGVWEGSGVLAYQVGEDLVEREFGQRISFSHDGTPHLTYRNDAWLLPEGGEAPDSPKPLFSEIGFWRLARRLDDGDGGPGMLPPTSEARFTTAEQVETLRNAQGGFDLEVNLVQPGGVSELYLGQVAGPRIDLETDAVVRTASAKDYTSATRLYGLVENHLLWAWDIAALGQGLRTHASGRLARAE